MRRIDNYEDLLKEKRRLRAQKVMLEARMSNDVQNIKHSLKPANMFLTSFDNSISGKPNFFNESINSAIDMLLKKGLLKNRGLIIKLIIPYFVKNFANNYLSSHRDDILGWVMNKFGTVFSKNGKEKHFDQSTVDANMATW
jgi:hypothetical protein